MPSENSTSKQSKKSGGFEKFWPTSLDRESEKAARILQMFCKDGFYKEQSDSTEGKSGSKSSSKSSSKTLVKIPQEVLQQAVGLAIFSVGRLGTWMASVSGGSGVLLARQHDGTWSPPAAITVSSLGIGMMGGIDVYDCVIVINTPKALEAFAKNRFSLGGDAKLTVGPFGSGGSTMAGQLSRDKAPAFTYTKSRGFYAGVQVDGTVIGQRNDENSRFYGQQVTAEQVLRVEIKQIPGAARVLQEAIYSAEGKVQHGERLMTSNIDDVDRIDAVNANPEQK